VAIIDPQEELAFSNEEQLVDLNDVETPQEQPQQEVEEENLPSKYKGKTVDEIIKMHQEAEKLIGRQAQEVGEVRKLADELLKRQLKTEEQYKSAPPTVEHKEVDFFEDPDTAVSRKIDSHPAIVEAKQLALQNKQMQTLNRLKENFPDFAQTAQDPEFAEWVKASPVRVRLYTQADAEFDYDAAAELLTTWKYVKPQSTKTAEIAPEVKQAQKAAVKAATVDVGGTPEGNTSRKIYRRVDLIRLNLEDPERYEALQDEILAAYRDGRVR
jgi:hypothetical protein